MLKIWYFSYEARERLTKNQKQVLMKMFQANAYPRKDELCQAATSLTTSKQKIQRWLVQMRMRKRAQGELLESE